MVRKQVKLRKASRICAQTNPQTIVEQFGGGKVAPVLLRRARQHLLQ